MEQKNGKFKILLKIHQLGDGGHMFWRDKQYIGNPLPGQIWTGKKETDLSFGADREIQVVHSIYIYFPDSLKFEPGKDYFVEAKIMSYESIDKNFNIGAKFEIRIGMQYDNKNWATGEILEVLDNE